MERTLCVWYPDWPLRHTESPPGEPVQAIGPDNRVVAVDALAAVAGIEVGMRRREAEARCPTVVTITADPGAEAAAFEPVAAALEAVIPRIEVERPGLAYLPVAGAVRYYGGEAAVVDAVVAALDAVGEPGARIGLAAGSFAARRAADLAEPAKPGVTAVNLITDDAAFLASLDVSSLGHEDLASIFRWLGITTLGALAALPRPAVVSRFGAEGLRAHHLASGEGPAARPRDIPADVSIEERFDPPLQDLEQAAFAARALAGRLLLPLAEQGVAPYRVEIEAEAEDGTRRIRVWRSPDPFDDRVLAERVRWQLRAWLDTSRRNGGAGIRGGVVRLRLTPADLSGEGRQAALGEDLTSQADVERALAETQAILGPDAVLQAELQGGRSPRERTAWRRWGDPAPPPQRDPDAPWPGAVPSPAPALVPPAAPRLEVEWDGGIPTRVRLGSRWEPVLSWAGPWRDLGRWWEGAGPTDRYQLVTSAGAMLCEVRDGATWLAGVYD